MNYLLNIIECNHHSMVKWNNGNGFSVGKFSKFLESKAEERKIIDAQILHFNFSIQTSLNIYNDMLFL